MPNPYTNFYAPSTFEQLSPEDKAMLIPTYQNTGSQQAYMNQQLAQGNQYAQPSSHGNGYSGLNALAMAAMLRKKDPYDQAQKAMDKYGAENVYGYGGQGQTPTSWNGEA